MTYSLRDVAVAWVQSAGLVAAVVGSAVWVSSVLFGWKSTLTRLDALLRFLCGVRASERYRATDDVRAAAYRAASRDAAKRPTTAETARAVGAALRKSENRIHITAGQAAHIRRSAAHPSLRRPDPSPRPRSVP